MSGGSYDYAYRRIDELERWVSTLRGMAADCRKWAARLDQMWVSEAKADRPATDEDRARTLVPAIRLELAADELEQAIRRVRDLEQTMHDVEWIESGDYGPDHFARKVTP